MSEERPGGGEGAALGGGKAATLGGGEGAAAGAVLRGVAAAGGGAWGDDGGTTASGAVVPDGPWPADAEPLDDFVARMLVVGDELYRDLPWRYVDDPYAVLVSEIMLQQTQVSRVARFWERFLSAFPTVDALAAAATADVLELWQGLGYNRRALALKRTADVCAEVGEGRLPRTYDGLLALPGIGPATAAGVMAFAYREPSVYLETNVRAVFIHELFPEAEKVPDRALQPLVAAAAHHSLAAADPRRWYYGLLDFGAHLKATGTNPARRSAGHRRQSAFEGSRRQKRAWLVRRVLADGEGVPAAAALADLNEAERAAGRDGVDGALFDSIVDDLVSEGFFRRVGDRLVP